jgi:coenzyme F420-reducing hydrogenase delta subunit
MLSKMLGSAGFDARRLRLEWFSPDDAERFVACVRDFAEEIDYLGPAETC